MPRPVEGGAELNDDRRGDVRHDAQRDDREALERAAGEGVEDVEDAAALRLIELRHGRGIDARNRDERQQPEQDQRADREPQPFLELGRLLEIGERNTGSELFGCGCHAVRKSPRLCGSYKLPRRHCERSEAIDCRKLMRATLIATTIKLSTWQPCRRCARHGPCPSSQRRARRGSCARSVRSNRRPFRPPRERPWTRRRP